MIKMPEWAKLHGSGEVEMTVRVRSQHSDKSEVVVYALTISVSSPLASTLLTKTSTTYLSCSIMPLSP